MTTQSTRFVATFIGAPAMNLIDAAVAHGVVRAPDLAIPVPDPAAGRVLVGVRPNPGTWHRSADR